MAVRSRTFVFYQGSPGNGVTQLLYTVPAGRTAVVRRYSLLCEANGPVAAYLGVRRGSVDMFLDANRTLVPGATLHAATEDLVLNPGDGLIANVQLGSGTNTTCSIYAAGSLLLGAPE